MPFVAGKSAALKLDDSGGTLRDISAYIDDASDNLSRDMLDSTTYGQSAHTFIPGLNNGTISISGKYDSTATTGPDAVLSSLLTATASATFEYGPEGSTTGKIKYTGECWLSSYEVSAPVADIVSFSAELQCSGAVTRTTFA